jgi:hypothetical protein
MDKKDKGGLPGLERYPLSVVPMYTLYSNRYSTVRVKTLTVRTGPGRVPGSSADAAQRRVLLRSQ